MHKCNAPWCFTPLYARMYRTLIFSSIISQITDQSSTISVVAVPIASYDFKCVQAVQHRNKSLSNRSGWLQRHWHEWWEGLKDSLMTKQYSYFSDTPAIPDELKRRLQNRKTHTRLINQLPPSLNIWRNSSINAQKIYWSMLFNGIPWKSGAWALQWIPGPSLGAWVRGYEIVWMRDAIFLAS